MKTESSPKRGIHLADYDYASDLNNRLLLAELTASDLILLEEILYSPLRIPIAKLSCQLNFARGALMEGLHKLAATQLFSFAGATLVVDKERRKYFENELPKFTAGYIPGLDYIHRMLKKVPIHVLPLWYGIPCTSNDLFQSLIDAYFATPQLFHRYQAELKLQDPLLQRIVDDVYAAADLKLSAATLRRNHSLTPRQLSAYLLQLEFYFLCFVSYEKTAAGWREIVTPFHEWREYLSFLRQTVPQTLDDAIATSHSRPYAFVEDLAALLRSLPRPAALLSEGPTSQRSWQDLGKRSIDLQLTRVEGTLLYPTANGKKWLQMERSEQALFIYRYPKHSAFMQRFSSLFQEERYLRRAERCIARVLNKGWVLFDDFIRGVTVPLGQQKAVALQKVGSSWRYVLPSYSQEEVDMFQEMIGNWFFETGLVEIGWWKEKLCFRTTELAHTIFMR